MTAEDTAEDTIDMDKDLPRVTKVPKTDKPATASYRRSEPRKVKAKSQPEPSDLKLLWGIYKRHNAGLWITLTWLEFAFIIWIKIGR